MSGAWPAHRWIVLGNEDPRGRALADRHYSRQTIGAKGYLPPGRRFALYIDLGGEAIWSAVWNLDPIGTPQWRNTIYRNESIELSSDLIFSATLDTYRIWVDRYDRLPEERLTTEIDVRATARRRSKRHRAGHCYELAGWRFVRTKIDARSRRGPRAVYTA